MNMHELHRRALEAARKFFQIEAELLDLIQKIDACKGFRDLGHASLFSYAVGELKLSESVALNLINVARKAVQVPVLKREIQAGNLSVCKARKIVPVLNLQNQAEWIEKAKTLPARQLEREIAKVAPTAAFAERVRYATENRLNLSLSVDEKTIQAIRRVQDLECQRKGRAVSLEETLAAMAGFYVVEKNDPVEKAKRALTKTGRVDMQNLFKRCEADEKPVIKGGAYTDRGSGKKSNKKTGQERTDVTATGHVPMGRMLNANGSEQTGRSLKLRQPIPSATEHAVLLRDGGRCTSTNSSGQRCESGRWLHVHHLQPVSHGGGNALENLTTLCTGHHRLLHAKFGSPG